MANPVFDETKPFEKTAAPAAGKPAFDETQPFQPAEPQGFLGKASNAIDKYTGGAAARSLIGKAQGMDRPFTTDPSQAPTGKEIVMKAGYPQEGYNIPAAAFPLLSRLQGKKPEETMMNVSPEVAGAAMDMAANPLNFVGGLLGKAAQGGAGLINKAGRALGYLGEGETAAGRGAAALEQSAAKAATRAIGRPTPTVATQMAKSGDDAKLGRLLLDEGAVPILGTPGRIQKRIEGLRGKNWEGVEGLLNKGGEAPSVNMTEAGMSILDNPKLQALRDAGETGAAKAYEDAAESIANLKDTSLQKAQGIKRTLDDLINYNKGIPDAGGIQEARFAKRTAVRDAMDAAAERLGADKGELKAALKKQGLLEKGAALSEREAGRTQTNDFINLKDLLMSQLGPTDLAKAGLALGSKGVRSFGNAAKARGLDAAAGALRAPPNVGPATMAAQGLLVNDRNKVLLPLQPRYADER